jgi:uncharacterized protein
MRTWGRGRRLLAAAVAVLALAGATACNEPGSGGGDQRDGLERVLRGTEPAPWEVRAGVEAITVTGAEPEQPLTLYGRRGRRLITLLADAEGQAQFSYLPARHATVQSGAELDYADLGDLSEGGVVEAGTYVVRDDSVEPHPATSRIHVLGRDDTPDAAFYDEQELQGVELDITSNPKPGTTFEDGFQYIEARDGVLLSTMVRFPDSALYGPPPYPTVVEYSGYSPSNPAREEPGVRLARAFGYATVSVNMRGTGCSGGVFDIFNPAQAADGYDVIEVVGRQPWVLDGRVGMVGLSYSGISQLYVAATRPPHLAGVTAQSVIADPWLMQWPGGIFNSGFTEQWLAQRERASAPGGTSWVTERIDAGDTDCAAHQPLRLQNPDFRSFGAALDAYPPAMEPRDLRRVVHDIEVPVYLTAAFQDEQTGPQAITLLDEFENAPVVRAGLWNGRHPDGYAPTNLNSWFEFLEFYVHGQVPQLNALIRGAAPALLADQFGLQDAEIDPDRFVEEYGDDVDAARAAYEAEDPITVSFESGAGENEVGEAGGTFEETFATWPTDRAEARTWYLGRDGALSSRTPRGRGGADSFRFDAEAGAATLFGGTGEYPLTSPTWPDAEWTRFDEGEELGYLTPPLEEDMVVAGPGYADLYVRSDAEDVTVQVSISEVRPDGVEYLVTNGWLRLAHREVDDEQSSGTEVVHSFLREDIRPVRPGRWMRAQVDLPSFAHAFREGSRLRLSITTPGRNHATWEFENPDYGGALPVHTVARTPERASALVLPVLDGVDAPDAPVAPCPGLRGMACRPYEATTNTAAE